MRPLQHEFFLFWTSFLLGLLLQLTPLFRPLFFFPHVKMIPPTKIPVITHDNLFVWMP